MTILNDTDRVTVWRVCNGLVVIAVSLCVGGCLYTGEDDSDGNMSRDAKLDVADTAVDSVGDSVDGDADVGDLSDETDGTSEADTEDDVEEDLQGGNECSAPKDCPDRGACIRGYCHEPTCSDGIVNQGETGEDCGGPCRGCQADAKCANNDDCASGVCEKSICQEPTCSDDVKNGEETDVDCGGSECDKCGACDSCDESSDCSTTVGCTSGTCGIC